MGRGRVVTLDGPAGAGKSTVARLLAEVLGFRLLDTGAMYRVVTLAALERGVDLESDAALGALARTLVLELEPGRARVNGRDVTTAIRTVEVTRASRHAADSPSVRAVLRDWQRAAAREHDLVTEGRDQGTVVFPDALCKFYLEASDEERARRRAAEIAARGEPVAFQVVLHDIRERDARDRSRAIAPMKPAADAIVVDTTALGIDEVVNQLAAVVRARLAAASS